MWLGKQLLMDDRWKKKMIETHFVWIQLLLSIIKLIILVTFISAAAQTEKFTQIQISQE